jgi:Integrase core domain
MLGDPCRPQAQGDRCDRRSVRPLLLQGIPAYIRSDNGPEFFAKALQKWIAVVGAKTAYIERGSPWENGYIESFNARLRDQLLDGEIFLHSARGPNRHRENTIRPHASLGYKPPAPEVFVPAFVGAFALFPERCLAADVVGRVTASGPDAVTLNSPCIGSISLTASSSPGTRHSNPVEW